MMHAWIKKLSCMNIILASKGFEKNNVGGNYEQKHHQKSKHSALSWGPLFTQGQIIWKLYLVWFLSENSAKQIFSDFVDLLESFKNCIYLDMWSKTSWFETENSSWMKSMHAYQGEKNVTLFLAGLLWILCSRGTLFETQ